MPEPTEDDLAVNAIMDDLSGKLGRSEKQNSILMYQVTKLSRQLEDMTKQRDDALLKSREAPVDDA